MSGHKMRTSLQELLIKYYQHRDVEYTEYGDKK